ncbi:MAG TPA: LuxR C-terminal-related transcriptional regulator [Nannocystaceae bacterium]|nr:LuxR C-terminal-related transcriptional regulator [Nannocystaceae bacterium]
MSTTTDYAEEERTELGTPYLEVVRGAPPGPPHRLGPGAFVMGREAGVEVVLGVDGVSRKHARVTVEPSGAAKVIDLSSRNGTFLNGRRIEESPLRDGDELRVGPVVLRFRYVRSPDRSEHERGQVVAISPAPPAAGAGVPQGTPAPGRPPDLPLSARELEVAKLVAEGMTNAEIGARLHISPATVGRHLSNVYERLGIHSRAALAAKLGIAAR